MKRRIRKTLAVVRAFVCMALVVNIHLMAGGCATNGGLLTDGKLLIPLTPDHPLSQTLASTAFAGATGLEVDTSAGRFRLIHPDQARSISGAYSLNKNSLSFTNLHLENGGRLIDIALDAEKHIGSIESSIGTRWERPEHWTGLPSDVVAGGIDAYMGANAELVELARQLDGEPTGGVLTSGTNTNTPPSSPSAPSGKTNQSAQDATGGLNEVLGVLGLLLGIQLAASNFPALFTVFQIMVSLQLGMAIAGVGPSPGTATPGNGTGGEAVTGTATLLVSNNLTDGTPIWFVTLIEDPSTGSPGGNLLGDQSIPAGSFRDFSVPAGVRDINIIVPNGTECFRLFQHKGVVLADGEITELTLSDSDVGSSLPAGCDGG